MKPMIVPGMILRADQGHRRYGSATLCTMPLIPGVLRYVVCGGVRAGWVERASDGRTVIDRSTVTELLHGCGFVQLQVWMVPYITDQHVII